MAANPPARPRTSKRKPLTSSRRSPTRPPTKFRDVAGQAEHFANRVAEQGREVGDKVQEVAGNLKGAVDKSVRDQPMATLAMAAVLGFVLGAIWKS
jgi:ElaB/YqjD/DUF883 family membrane-anchored ribosome-binding protein